MITDNPEKTILPYKRLTKIGFNTLKDQLTIIFIGVGFFLSFSASIANALIDLPFWINIPHIINALICAVMPFLFKKNIVRAAIIELIFATYIYFPFIYFTNAAYTGSGLFYFLMAVFWLSFYLNKRNLYLILGFSLLYYTIMVIISFNYPQLVVSYPDSVTHVVDILIAIFCVSISISVVTGVTFRAYQEENEKVNLLIEDLHERNGKLEKLSITDQLTGLYNRRYFIETFIKEKELTGNSSRSMTVLMLDVDHFKYVNDTYGHQYGDEILKSIAGVIRENVRPHDTVARYGGEEFIALILGANLEKSKEIAERIRKSVEHMKYRQNNNITISIGAAYNETLVDLDLMIKEADKQLYHAKNGGRNQVSFKL